MTATNGTTQAAANVALLRQRHRRQRLLEVARELGRRVRPEELRGNAQAEGLDPGIVDCREALEAVYPGEPEPPRDKPAQRNRWSEGKTNAAMILEVARKMPDVFTLSELVVCCWRADPLRFSLPGFTQFPGEHRVRCALFGSRGLISRGLLLREGERFLRAKEGAT